MHVRIAAKRGIYLADLRAPRDILTFAERRHVLQMIILCRVAVCVSEGHKVQAGPVICRAGVQDIPVGGCQNGVALRSGQIFCIVGTAQTGYYVVSMKTVDVPPYFAERQIEPLSRNRGTGLSHERPRWCRGQRDGSEHCDQGATKTSTLATYSLLFHGLLQPPLSVHLQPGPRHRLNCPAEESTAEMRIETLLSSRRRGRLPRNYDRRDHDRQNGAHEAQEQRDGSPVSEVDGVAEPEPVLHQDRRVLPVDVDEAPEPAAVVREPVRERRARGGDLEARAPLPVAQSDVENPSQGHDDEEDRQGQDRERDGPGFAEPDPDGGQRHRGEH